MKEFCKIAYQLRSWGLDERSRVGIVVPNGLDMSAILLAVTSTSVAAPLNPSYRESEFQSYLNDIQADCIIVLDKDRVSPVRAVAHDKGIPIVELASDGITLSTSADIAKILGRCDKPSPGEIHSGPKPDDIALVLLTSGSTGRSKRVPLTHRNLCASVADICFSLNLDDRDSCLSMWEQFHIGGLVDLLLVPLASGGRIICTGEFDAEQFFRSWILDRRPGFRACQQPCTKSCRGAKSRTSLSKNVFAVYSLRGVGFVSPIDGTRRGFFQVPVVQTFGMTEAGPLITTNPLPPGSEKPARPALAVVRLFPFAARMVGSFPPARPAKFSCEEKTLSRATKITRKRQPSHSVTVGFTRGTRVILMPTAISFSRAGSRSRSIAGAKR